MTTLDRVAAIVQEIAPDRPAPVHATSFDELGLDSLSCIELTVAVEDEFGVEVGCADRIAFETVGDVVAFVDAQTRPLPLAA